MNPLTKAAAIAAAWLLSTGASAALPESGLWGVGEEMNGQPGRGVQIDRQGGETVIASYYGYREDGSATFYQAVGRIQDGKTLSADLVEYKNGPVLGGTVRNGEIARTIGPVIMEFETPSSGFITLPGESKKRFSPLVYEDLRGRLNNTFRAVRGNQLMGSNDPTLQNIQMQTQGDRLKVTILNEKYGCTFEGPLVANGGSFSAQTEGGCTSAGIVTMSRKFEDIRVSEDGALSMTIAPVTDSFRMVFDGTILGMCVLPIPYLRDTRSPATPCPPSQLHMTEAAQ